MPRRYGRKKYRKKRKGKKMYKVSTSKLRDKRINSLIEHRIQDISRREAQASRVKLVHRLFYGGNYDEFQDTWSSSVKVDRAGWTAILHRIKKADVEMVQNQPAADDPQTFNGWSQQGNEALDGDGLAQGMITQIMHGRRSTESVLLTGVSLETRCTLPKDSSLNGARRNAHVQWAVVAIFSDDIVVQPNAVEFEPAPEEIIQLRTMGFTPQIDLDEVEVRKKYKKRVLLKGSSYISRTSEHSAEKNTKKYVKLKTPMRLDYDPTDQNGTQPTKVGLYLVVRSNIAFQSAEEDKPNFNCVAKLYYLDN